MTTSSQRRLSASSLVLLAVAFVAAVIISNRLFSGWRLDLTENNLYTLSEGTHRIVESIEEPINLYFYYSDQATENIPSLRDYANRVREMLEEFDAVAGEKIRLSVIDPQPFSEEEDRASQFGLQGVQLPNAPDAVYFGLAGTNALGDQEIIEFFQPDKAEFLEYDIARLVSTLADPERQVVGLVSGVPMSGEFNPQTRQMAEPWMVYQEAEQLLEIRDLGTSFDSVDEDVSLLWIVQPKDLDDETVYAIDQFLMRGGKALIFVDPVAEADPSRPPQGMPQGMPTQGQSSNLPRLFEAWGLEYSPDEVVTDAELALQLSGGPGRRPVRHLAFLGVNRQQLSSDDITTAGLGSLNLATAGHLAQAEGSTLTFEPLISSSTASSTTRATRFSYLPDPSVLQDGFAPGGEAKVLGARLSGVLKSAFPDGPPAGGDGADDAGADAGEAAAADDGEDADEEEASGPRPHLAEGTEPANIIAVADVDMLSDRMWVQVQSFFGQQVANAFAGNGAFTTNALENLSGSSDLIAVRSRATHSRPFTRVEELRAAAEAKFRETEQRLQQELQQTEQRLSELQSAREDTGELLLTEEQQAEIDRFVDRRAQIRQELRAVRHDLDKDIERLGTVLKVVNIGLVPLLLTAFVLTAVWRRKRR